VSNDQMTVAQAFQQFLQDLEITEKQRKCADEQKARVRAVLAAHLKPDKVFVSGSYDRRTAIRPLNDIDLFMVLNESVHGGLRSQSTQPCLDAVLAALQRAHPSGVSMRRQRRSVNISFQSTGIGYDVVPAFRVSGKHDVYIIPDAERQSWIATNPAQHAALCNQADARNGHVLKGLIKAAKHWNVQHGKQLRSFHLEVMAYSIKFRSPSSLLERFQQLLAHLADKVLVACPDPADPTRAHIDQGMPQDQRQQRAQQLRKEVGRIQHAIELVNQGRPVTEAHQILRKLLGDIYPGR
jgi:hypothetical protein